MKKIVKMMIILSFCFLVSCGKEETIDGKWVLCQQKYADGTIVKGDDMKVYECYEVSGDKASYTCIAEPLGERKLEFMVEKTGDNEYCFKISDTLIFSTCKLEGNNLSYTIGEGENAVLFVFQKK